MKIVISCMFFIVSFSLVSQNISRVSGLIQTKKDSSVLEFGTIAILGTSVGTVANEKGYFELIIPMEIDDDFKIIISHLGYEDYIFSPNELKKERILNIYVKEKAYTLPDVEVTPPIKIVERAIENIKNNYIDIPFYSKVYFRETIQHGSEYKRLIEAAGVLLSDGYAKKPKKRKSGYNIYIDHIRKSVNMHLDDPLLYNSWDFLLNKNFVKQRSLLANTSILKDFDFELIGITILDNKNVYLITFKPKKGTGHLNIGIGELYIELNTYAYVAIKFGFDSRTNGVEFPKYFNDGKLIYHKEELRFKQLEGKYFLSYIEQEYMYESNEDSLQKIFSSQMLVNEILLKDQYRPNRHNLVSSRKDVYLTKRTYNPQFWKNYNYIQVSEKYKKIIADLEDSTGLNIETQFKKTN